LVISRTPFRISFFGGGTDLPIWCNDHEGFVVSTTIDKYCYVNARIFPPFFNHKHRIIYSEQERVNSIKEIKHPAVRAVMEYLNIDSIDIGLEIQTTGDLPSKSGLGSSSSFVVGMLNSLHKLKNSHLSKHKLYEEAIYIEQKILKENVGSQDQVAASVGGLNAIKFNKENIDIIPIFLNKEIEEKFENNLMLFFTGFTRFASEIEGDKIKQAKNKIKYYEKLYNIANEGFKKLKNGNIYEIGELLHENWLIKKSLSDKVSNEYIDNIYKKALYAGAIGGKITGAGGGGFLLLYVNKEHQESVKRELKDLLYIPFKFDNEGSKIIYSNGDRI